MYKSDKEYTYEKFNKILSENDNLRPESLHKEKINEIEQDIIDDEDSSFSNQIEKRNSNAKYEDQNTTFNNNDNSLQEENLSEPYDADDIVELSSNPEEIPDNNSDADAEYFGKLLYYIQGICTKALFKY